MEYGVHLLHPTFQEVPPPISNFLVPLRKILQDSWGGLILFTSVTQPLLLAQGLSAWDGCPCRDYSSGAAVPGLLVWLPMPFPRHLSVSCTPAETGARDSAGCQGCKDRDAHASAAAGDPGTTQGGLGVQGSVGAPESPEVPHMTGNRGSPQPPAHCISPRSIQL